MTTDKNLAREIAERLTEAYDEHGPNFTHYEDEVNELARAYLELEAKYYELGEEEIQNTIQLETHLAEIHKRGEEIDRLESELAKLKKALDLAMYYVNGDSSYEILKAKIAEILK